MHGGEYAEFKAISKQVLWQTKINYREFAIFISYSYKISRKLDRMKC